MHCFSGNGCSEFPESMHFCIGILSFPSYNCFAHAKEKNAAFVIRAKDTYVTRLLRDAKPDSDEFDLSVERIIVRHTSKKQYLHPELKERYRYVDANTSFDFIEHGKRDEYELHLRVVRIKIKDEIYENLITNLSPEEFSANDLKELYHLRWNRITISALFPLCRCFFNADIKKLFSFEMI